MSFCHKINEMIIIIIIIILIIIIIRRRRRRRRRRMRRRRNEERWRKSGLLYIIMCLQMRMEGWYEDDLHGSAQVCRCKAFPSHGLLCHTNFMSWGTVPLLFIHSCINICLVYSRVVLPIE
jgi:hypothetical protein